MLAFAASAGLQAQVLPSYQTDSPWYTDAQTNIASKLAQTNGVAAKNVILFVGDGMGISTLTASRIYQGQLLGNPGEEGYLSFESFPYTALVKTYNVDAQTPDSAGTMTAMMAGLKTDVGVIGVDEDIVRGDCSTVAGNEVATLLEMAEIAGLSTGVVSTARITHATPAATYAKSADRNWEDISDFSDPADHVSNGGDCTDIALQLVEFETNLEARYPGIDVDGIEVMMGGGRRHFLPNDPAFNSPDAVSSTEGDRTDGRDLPSEWVAANPDGTYVYDQTGFDMLDLDATGRVLGLFNESHMQYEADRANDIAGEPSVAEMTSAAIDLLDNNENGFFLMVESGRIDHAHHAGNAYGAINDTLAFADAVQAAYDATNPEDTLILVTADHSHVFTIAGYPKRGNPILGKVVGVGEVDPALASDSLPYTTVGYTNGLGFRDGGTETNSDTVYSDGIGAAFGRQDLTVVDTEAPGYHQETLVPLGSETHAGEDITIHATGPSSHLVQGTVEQNVVFHVMNSALGLVAE